MSPQGCWRPPDEGRVGPLIDFGLFVFYLVPGCLFARAVWFYSFNLSSILCLFALSSCACCLTFLLIHFCVSAGSVSSFCLSWLIFLLILSCIFICFVSSLSLSFSSFCLFCFIFLLVSLLFLIVLSHLSACCLSLSLSLFLFLFLSFFLSFFLSLAFPPLRGASPGPIMARGCKPWHAAGDGLALQSQIGLQGHRWVTSPARQGHRRPRFAG